MTTMLDEVLSAVDAGASPSPTAVQDWVHRFPDATAAAQELARVRQRVAAARPSAAAEQVDEVLASVLELAVQSLTQRAIDEALQDAVTGLPTRRLFERDCRRALAAAVRSSRPVSVVMVDVDGLKKVNDTHGHAAGDTHLHAVAEALRSVVREGDGAYRVGGDEFVVLLADADEAAAACVMGRYAGPPVSWGVATSADGEVDIDRLLATADARMYRTRQARRSVTPAADRPRSRGLALAGFAAVVATLGTGALMTVTTGSSERSPAPAPVMTAPAAPADPAPQLPVAAPVAPAPAAPAPAPAGVAPVQQVVVPAVPLPPLAAPLLPATPPAALPPLETPALPQPSPDPGAVTTVVEETVTLVDQTVCRLLC